MDLLGREPMGLLPDKKGNPGVFLGIVGTHAITVPVSRPVFACAVLPYFSVEQTSPVLCRVGRQMVVVAYILINLQAYGFGFNSL